MVESMPLAPRDPGVCASKAVELHRSGRQHRAKAMILRAARAANADGEKWQSVIDVLRPAALDELLVSTLDQYARAHPHRAVNWSMLGRAFRSLERLTDATQTFERATSLEPSSAESWFEQIWAAVDAERDEAALKAIEKLAALDAEARSNPLLLAFQSISLCRTGRIDDAMNTVSSIAAGKVEPGVRSYLMMAYSLIAESLVERNRATDALRLLEEGRKVIEELYERPRPAFQRGLALFVLGNFDGAVVAFETTDANTSDARTKLTARFHLALALEKLGRFPEALAKIEAVLSGELDEATLTNAQLMRSRLLNATGSFAEAVRSYERIAPEKLERLAQGELFVGRAVALIHVGRSEEALPDLVRAEAANDDPAGVPVILFWRASALRRLNRVSDALAVLERAEAAGLPEPLRGLAGFEYGICLQTLGRTDEALTRVDQALRDKGSTPLAFALLQIRARILASGRRMQEAFDAYALARAQAPEGLMRGVTMLEMAEVAESLGRNEDAKHLAGTALDQIPDDAAFLEPRSRALGILVRASLNLGDKRAALDALDRLPALSPGPDVPLPLLRIRLDLHLHFGERDRALAMLDDLASKGAPSASHPFLVFARGEILRQMGRDPADVLAAMKAGARVPQQFDRDSLAWLTAGMALTMQEQWTEAERALQRVVELEPAAANQPVYIAYSGMVQRGLGKTSEALAILDAAKAATGLEGVLVNVSRGQILMTVGRLDEAAQAFERAIELHKTAGYPEVTVVANALVGRGQALLRLKRFDEAMEGFDETLRLLGDARGFADVVRVSAMVGRAFVYHQQKRRSEALAVLDDAILLATQMSKALPYRGLAWWCKGLVLQEQDKDEEALALFRRAGREGVPGNMGATSEGDALLALEDWDGALAAFDSALSLAADSEQKFEAYSGKGRALHRRHDLQQAVETYRAALALECESAKTNPVIHHRLGETYYALGRHRAALQAYRSGWERDRSSKRSPDLALGVSAALMHLGQNSEALSFLEQAESLAREDARLAYNRAVALLRLGEIDAAKGLLARAVDKGLAEAGELLAKITRAASGAKPWLDYWFGRGADLGTRALGVLLLSFVGFSLLVPIVLVLSDFAVDWKVLLAAPAVALLLLVLPGVRNLAFSYGDLKFEASPSSSDAADAGTSLSKMAVALMVPGSLGAQSPRVTSGTVVSASDEAYAMASYATLIKRR